MMMGNTNEHTAAEHILGRKTFNKLRDTLECQATLGWERLGYSHDNHNDNHNRSILDEDFAITILKLKGAKNMNLSTCPSMLRHVHAAGLGPVVRAASRTWDLC